MLSPVCAAADSARVNVRLCSTCMSRESLMEGNIKRMLVHRTKVGALPKAILSYAWLCSVLLPR